MYKVSIIVPAFNEEENISNALDDIISSFVRLNIKGEIIVVNDGSTDKTENIVKKFISNYNFIKIFNHDKNQGMGKTYWDGVQHASGEFITSCAGDGEDNSYEILRYISMTDHVDIIIPFIFNQGVRKWTRRFISKLYKGIINISFGYLINYMNGPVVYRKCVLEQITLQSKGFFFQTELLIKSLKTGYLYAEVPCGLNKRAGGSSSALTFKSFFNIIYCYISTLIAVYFSKEKHITVDSSSATAKRKNKI